MSTAVAAFAAFAAQLAIAWGLGRGIVRACARPGAPCAIAGGAIGECWLGFCAASIALELAIGCAPAFFPLAAWMLHGLGAALALGFAVHRARGFLRARSELAQDPILARGALLIVLLVALGLACLFGGVGLPGVDALEVYQLKARALHDGTLEELSPRTLGSAHPLFVPIAVAWHARLTGAITAEAQRWFSLLAWAVAAVVFASAASRALPRPRAAIASAAFALAPPLLVIAARAEADLPLIASVLAAVSAWSSGGARSRVIAVLFAAGAAGAKNEGLAWIAIAGCAYVLGTGLAARRERFAVRCGAAFAAALGLCLLRLPAMIARARWGAFVEHLDRAPLDVVLDPLYLLLRGEAILTALARAGFSAESGYAAVLWMLALGLWCAGRMPRAGEALFLGGVWLACVFAGMLVGAYDAAWQASVAAARVWVQGSPWLVLALAMTGLPAGARSRLAGWDVAGSDVAASEVPPSRDRAAPSRASP